MTFKQTLQQFLQMNEQDRTRYFEQHHELLQQLTSHIDTLDAELRDQYIYHTFVELLRHNLLNAEQLKALFHTINEHYLFLGLGDQQTDSVFSRSFAALLMADLLTVDQQQRILPADVLTPVFEKLATSLLYEQDTRVFVEGKGWAHSIAAYADLLVIVIQHDAFPMQLAYKILQSLKDTSWKGYVYTDDEEERFNRIIQALIAKNVPEDILIEWTEQSFDKLDMHLMLFGYNEAFFKGRTCTLHLMKTCYFALKMNNQMPLLQNVIYGQIGKWFSLR